MVIIKFFLPTFFFFFRLCSPSLSLVIEDSIFSLLLSFSFLFFLEEDYRPVWKAYIRRLWQVLVHIDKFNLVHMHMAMMHMFCSCGCLLGSDWAAELNQCESKNLILFCLEMENFCFSFNILKGIINLAYRVKCLITFLLFWYND